MKTKEILINAINKAVENGYEDPGVEKEIGFYLDGNNCYSILFDHKFAKAFWAIKGMKLNFNFLEHLKIMSAYEEPLKYIEKFIK